MPSSKGSMAPSIVNNDAVQGENFLPGQIFVFGGFAPRANSFGHLEQIDSYGPGHQARLGSLNYVADTRGDLIFAGFETAATAPSHLDEHDLNLSSDRIQEIAPVTTLALDPEHTATSKDWRLNPTTEATDSPVLEPHMDLTSHDICVTGTPDSSLVISSEPCESADAELDRLTIFEVSAADIFQHSPIGVVLNSLKNLSQAGDSQPNYVRFELEASDGGEFSFPPATHFIATVKDLTDITAPKTPTVWTTMPRRSGAKTRRLPDAGRPLLRTTCTWWIHL